MVHKQPPTPLLTDNITAANLCNQLLKQKRLNAIDMHFYWLRDRTKQGQFHIFWASKDINLGYYFTKHFRAIHHRRMRGKMFNTPQAPRVCWYIPEWIAWWVFRPLAHDCFYLSSLESPHHKLVNWCLCNPKLHTSLGHHYADEISLYVFRRCVIICIYETVQSLPIAQKTSLQFSSTFYSYLLFISVYIEKANTSYSHS